MTLPFLITDESDYGRALALIDDLWGAKPGTDEAQVLEVMAYFVDAYERAHSTLGHADPIALIEFKLAELGWSQRELGRKLGWGSGRVSEVLARKRPLTLRMVQELSATLGISAGLLVHDTRNDVEESALLGPFAGAAFGSGPSAYANDPAGVASRTPTTTWKQGKQA